VHENTEDGIRIEANLTSAPVTGLRITDNDVWNNVGLGIHLYSNDVLELFLDGNHCYDDQGVPTQTTSLYAANENSKTLTIYEGNNRFVDTTPYGTSGAGAASISRTTTAYKTLTSQLTNSTFDLLPASGSYLRALGSSGGTMATFNAGEGSGIAAYKGSGATYAFSAYNSTDTTTLALRVDASSNVQLRKILGITTGGVLDIQPGSTSYARILDYNGNIAATFDAGEGSGVAAYKPTTATYALSVYNSADSSTLVFRIDGSGHFNVGEGSNLILGTTTGTKIGTSTSQKLEFYNSTPIVKPSGSVLTALSNLGLVSSPTLAASELSIGVTGSGTVVLATSPTLATPVLGVATATTINKVTLTTPATGSTLTIADGKTLRVNQSITLSGTDGTTMTFPTTSATLARTDAGNTFTGHQTIEGVTTTGATGSGNLRF
jgi:hypothetical protein